MKKKAANLQPFLNKFYCTEDQLIEFIEVFQEKPGNGRMHFYIHYFFISHFLIIARKFKRYFLMIV